MRFIKLVTALLAAMCLLSSCDFLRSMVGKPTSKEIKQMKIEEMAKKKAVRDSIAAAKAAAKKAASMEAEIKKDTLENEFYVVLGSFKVPENAVKFKEALTKKGYEIKEVHFKDGFDVIMAGGTDSYSEAYKRMEEIMEFQFCPEDIWIYNRSMNLHE